MIVSLNEGNILTKFRENLMHVVHVVCAQMCTLAILDNIFDIEGYKLCLIVILHWQSFGKTICTYGACTNVHTSYFGLFFRFFTFVKVRMIANWQDTTQFEPNITGTSRDFKRARYQKLAFVEIWVLASTRALLTKKTCQPHYMYEKM